MTSAKTAVQQATPKVDVALSELRSKSFDDVSLLPEQHSIEFEEDGKRVVLTTYVDRISGSEIRVVVQLLAYGMLGSARILAKGFRKFPTGEVEDLTADDLYDFT